MKYPAQNLKEATQKSTQIYDKDDGYLLKVVMCIFVLILIKNVWFKMSFEAFKIPHDCCATLHL